MYDRDNRASLGSAAHTRTGLRPITICRTLLRQVGEADKEFGHIESTSAYNPKAPNANVGGQPVTLRALENS